MIHHIALTLAILSVTIGVLGTFINYGGTYPDKIETLRARVRGAVRSKTVWFNALALALVNQLPQLIDYAAQNLPLLQPYLPANHYTTIVGAITITNLILRYKTTHPLEAK